ncbi:gamma-glutamyltransferase family protein [Stackebrandtia nassauensis]|nr:gamma-glutamyltransferase [Stackebrandtia nassauensis]
MVVSADERASAAGVEVLRGGGTAVDAAIAANAVLAVTAPHLCGMGGDLFAVVQDGDSAPVALNASGRAGSGADPEGLRAAGYGVMPLFDDVRSVTVPGCVDGWVALHERFGRLALAEVFAAAVGFAEDGFGASPLLASAVPVLRGKAGAEELAEATWAGAVVRRGGVARALRAVAAEGRDGFYCGEFGRGLVRLADGLFSVEDLRRGSADWVSPIGVDAVGHRVWVTPPNSQGYLVGLGLAIADGLPLPDDPDDPLWAHLLIEAARRAGCDRPELLHEGFDAGVVLSPEEVGRRRGLIDPGQAAGMPDSAAAGDTTYLCAAEHGGLAVSLIQSNASGFGSRIFEPGTGIGLHNRGLGFSLLPGHPAEYRPGRRPPHTLAPALVTRRDGSTRALVGTMGGDTQPQILLQVITRLLRHGQSPAEAVGAARWRIGNSNGFDTWRDGERAPIELEEAAPDAWDRLEAKGHLVNRVPTGFGHAHVIEMDDSGQFAGAADPRTVIGSAQGRLSVGGGSPCAG